MRPQLEAIAERHGASLKVVEVPPGPPVQAPIVAEVYGPDYPGQIAVAQKLRADFAATPDIVDVDASVDEAAPKLRLRVDQAKAALMGVAQRDIVAACASALAGEDVTPLHDSAAKYEVPVRIACRRRQASAIESLLRLKVRGARTAA